ncbi:phosphoribosylamine--glycine ligase [Planctomycetales bacterium]|nr:phosphoribosylamine--glycine ligase [Planctomycetales bacterium]GHT02527.1 phosphoribosylamine--glycine ligase [Planctomycetales bacterium]
MNVLIIGGGGREHALAWKIAQSPRLTKLYIMPGNPGCAACGECVEDLDINNLAAIRVWAKKHAIDFVIPGPEAVLAAGIVDEFFDLGIKVFGPARKAAALESSKSFAKDLMRRYGIPTADYAVFEQAERAFAYLDSREEAERALKTAAATPLVVKADGLAAGKGAIVCENIDAARAAVRRCMVDKEFGDAGAKVVIEECLRGEELSVLALTDGKTIAPLASAQDHKAIFDGDLGPNTGGMGAYSPAPLLTEKLLDEVVAKILVPTVHAMNNESRRFRGVLYAGLMITKAGPKVLEYNMRFGDPETQPILMRLDGDLLEILLATTDGHLDRMELKWRDEAAVGVVMAAPGYPGHYEKGQAIAGLDKFSPDDQNTQIFHAGTIKRGGKIVTNGGRVLCATALGKDLPAAIASAYAAVEKITFAGAQYRKDIGQKALKKLA